MCTLRGNREDCRILVFLGCAGIHRKFSKRIRAALNVIGNQQALDEAFRANHKSADVLFGILCVCVLATGYEILQRTDAESSLPFAFSET